MFKLTYYWAKLSLKCFWKWFNLVESITMFFFLFFNPRHDVRVMLAHLIASISSLESSEYVVLYEKNWVLVLHIPRW